MESLGAMGFHEREKRREPERGGQNRKSLADFGLRVPVRLTCREGTENIELRPVRYLLKMMKLATVFMKVRQPD